MARKVESKATPRTIFYIHLPQDLDLLLPILKRLMEQNKPVAVWLRRGVEIESPRILPTLSKLGVPFRRFAWWRLRLGVLLPWATGEKLLTASESSAPPHRLAYRLTQRANEKGLKTCTVQHGFENIGLTYFDAEYPPGSVNFASKSILIWGPEEELDARVSQSVRRRCLALGSSKDYTVESTFDAKVRPEQKLIVIFENMHWSRFDEAYKQSFSRDVVASITQFPDTHFLIKPHPASFWAKEALSNLSTLSNVVLVDPRDEKWSQYSAPAFIQAADGVITTPSTVALDAAHMGCPVAVVAYGLDLPRYEPLALLQNGSDWRAFIESIDSAGIAVYGDKNQSFLERRMVGHGAVDRICDWLETGLR